MKGLFLTDKGKVRDHNEDAGGIYFNQDHQMLAIIADGMGGHQAGDVASQMAINYIQKEWEQECQLFAPEEIENWLKERIIGMNQQIFQHANTHSECHGMGTTIIAAICTEEFFTVAHVGDSRCYRNNEQGFQQITEDHSLVNALVRSGQITKEDAKYHPRKNVVLKAVGTDETVEADVRSMEWEYGDSLILCSDGLTDKLLDDDIANSLESKKDLNEKGKQLIDLANNCGGEDNISLIIIDHDMPAKEGEKLC